MRSLLSVISGILIAAMPVASSAQQCPAEVDQAKQMLAKVTSAQKVQQPPRQLAGARGKDQQAARGQEQQAPRGQEQQAPRGQEQQAPRGQEQQAPRGQEQQAPRGQEQQAPRGQEQQAPRGQEQQAPRAAAGAVTPDRGKTTAIANARPLVQRAEQACKQRDNAQAIANAKAAMELLKFAQ
ncbi:MAG: hypothetical protein ACREM3_01345 [Candidatus Rokuibacteriota bacterium]